MPNSQNRNNRRKREERSETLIIPHITKEMLELARSMADQGASRAEIEQALAQMHAANAAKKEEAAAAPAPAKQEPDSRRIIPKSRPRYSEEERKAMLEQMRREQEEQEAQRREEATRRTERPARSMPAKPERKEPRPDATVQMPAVSRPAAAEATVQMPAAPKAAPVPPQEDTTRAMPPVHRQEETAAPAAEPAATRQEPQAAPQPSQARKRHAGLLRSREEAEAELNEKIRSDHVWLSNPVMVRGLGLAPVVGAALDGQRALILCVACMLLITLTRVLAVAVCHLSNNRFRPIIYCYTAAVLYIPVYVLLYELFGNQLTALGIYLPILITEPAIVKRMEFTELESLRDALRHGFNNGLGMCASLLIVGCLREFLATGAVFGHTVLHAALLPLAAQPAGGFVLVGVIAAVWCAVANAYTDYKREEVRRLYANRKH